MSKGLIKKLETFEKTQLALEKQLHDIAQEYEKVKSRKQPKYVKEIQQIIARIAENQARLAQW